jgi:hypothetical protein
MNRLELTRFPSADVCIVGVLTVFDKNNIPLFSCSSLELRDLGNQKNISCIPLGVYNCSYELHKKFGVCFRIHSVAGRSGILIHVGNFLHEIRGCILVGSDASQQFNSRGYIVNSSRVTITRLSKLLPDNFSLIIK